MERADMERGDQFLEDQSSEAILRERSWRSEGTGRVGGLMAWGLKNERLKVVRRDEGMRRTLESWGNMELGGRTELSTKRKFKEKDWVW